MRHICTHPRKRRLCAVEALESRTLLSITIPPVPIPAAVYTFDEGAGLTAGDSSGNGHNAALGADVTWAPGNVGANAINLPGSANGVVTATGPDVNTAGSFTVAAWVNLASVSGYQTVVSIAGNNVAGFFLGLRADTGTFSFARLPSDNVGTATVVASLIAPVAGQWYEIVGVDDVSAATLSLYVDGQSVGAVPYAGGWKASGNTLIGHGFYGGQQVDFVDGQIDNVQFFSSALSAAQVAALNQPAFYSFDEGSGPTANDDSGHAHNLTLNSGATFGPGEIGSNSLAVNGTAAGNATYPGPVLNTTTSFTVSAWVELNSLGGYQTFVSMDGANTSAFYLQLRGDTGEFAFTRLASDNTSAAVSFASATAAPQTGVWYNLIGVDNVATGQLSLYVNGVLQSTAAYSGGWQGTGATVVGGGLFGGSRVDFVNGLIDDVHFYNSPLTDSDAAAIGSAGISTINIAAGSTGITVSPNLFGVFMEDINYAGEGGMYNDEVRNSGFNDSSNLLNAWSSIASHGVTDNLHSDTTTGPTAALTDSGKLTITSGVSATARAGIANSGYFGVAVAPSTTYSVDFFAKATAAFTGPLTVDIESTTGTVWAAATIAHISTAWTEYTAALTTGAGVPTTATNLFVISTTSPTANGATIWVGSADLYPPSYEGIDNHLRIDLMQDLAALKPAIFRVPGGNYLEGANDATSFQWQNTIGPIDDRPGHFNTAWGYWSTDGMGLDEYLQMAEEVGAAPILAVFAGYTLNGASDTGAALTADVTNAVNELHYVLDPVTTSWGAERAANGHPAPYNVNDVEVGNEDFFSSTYAQRYPLFYNAIHAAFPSLQIIATDSNTGGAPYNVIDEHFYQSPQWFQANSGMFDSAPRGGPQIFIGEYASQQGSPTGDMESALGDAAWLLGLERNSDLVTMSSYAPLFVNVASNQWPTNLIGFNTTSSYGSPTYYAQLMLSLNHGTTVVSSSISAAGGLQTLVTRTGTTYYLTVINTLGAPAAATINLTGAADVSPTATQTVLSAAAGAATNSIAAPTAVAPVTSTISGLAPTFTESFAGYSITILQFTAGIGPTVATPAAANPTTVTGTTTNLSVLGADGDGAGGEANLIYTWLASGPAPVNFSDNADNSAKNILAAFTQAGAYQFTVTIADAAGNSIASSVNVTVQQTAASVNVQGSAAVLPIGAAEPFAAIVLDQFGNAIAAAPVTFSITGAGNSITAAGNATLGATPGAFTVTAADGAIKGTASLTAENFAVPNGSTLNLTLGPAGAVSLSQSNGNFIAAQNDLAVTLSGFAAISVTDSASGDTLNLADAPAAPFTFTNSAASVVNLNSGMLLFAPAASPVNLGSLFIAAAASAMIAPTTGAIATTLTLNHLSIIPTGRLDLSNNQLLINFASTDPIQSIDTWLATGFNNGAWNGPGISSTSAAAHPAFSLGVADGNLDSQTPAAANQILVKYTLAGDAFLQGSIGFNDLIAVAQHFGATGNDWTRGNFNYDPNGAVGFADLIAVAQNFGASSGISAAVVHQPPQIAPSNHPPVQTAAPVFAAGSATLSKILGDGDADNAADAADLLS